MTAGRTGWGQGAVVAVGGGVAQAVAQLPAQHVQTGGAAEEKYGLKGKIYQLECSATGAE